MYVVETGAVSPLGPDIARMSCAVRAGASGYVSWKRFRSRRTAKPVVVGMVGSLSDDEQWKDRVISLCTQAVAPCRRLFEATKSTPSHILLSLPSLKPGLDETVLRGLAKEIGSCLPLPATRSHFLMTCTGHDAGLRLFREAAQLLEGAEPRMLLVGGADSWINRDFLAWVELQERLKTAVEPKGFVPSEGAAFLVLANEAWLTAHGVAARIMYEASGISEEPKPWYSGLSSIGEGLTSAIHDASAKSTERVGATFADHNGEAWRVMEWMYAYLRTARTQSEPLDLREPASAWGDLGAATGTMLAALASHELVRDDTLGRTLVVASSDFTPNRAALLLRKVEGFVQ